MCRAILASRRGQGVKECLLPERLGIGHCHVGLMPACLYAPSTDAFLCLDVFMTMTMKR